MTPLVSVVIPTYNRADLIRETIETALAQTYEQLEVLIVDDGSTDDTRLVVEQFGDHRLRYLHQENMGVSAARNHGIRASRGELIAFLDSDDLWEPHKLELQVALFEEANVGWAYCDFRHFGSKQAEAFENRFATNPPTRGMALAHFFIHRFPIQTSCLIARKKALESCGMFNESYSFAEDIDLYFRLAERFEVDFVDRVLVSFRYRPGSKVVPPVERLNRWIKVRTRILNDHPQLRTELSRRDLWSAYYRSVLKLAQWKMGEGQLSEARERLQEVLAFAPWNPKALALMALSFAPSGLQSGIKHPGEPGVDFE